MFNSLGGYATASAAVEDLDGVNWATRQTLDLAKRRGHPRELSYTLLECSMALATLGEDARAGTMRRRSLALAERYGFHDLIFKAQAVALPSLATKVRLSEAAQEIAERVTQMAPDQLPAVLVHAD
jgi:hypothetical protein